MNAVSPSHYVLLETCMESSEKAEIIRRWIDPQERITVDFEDQRDLNAEVVECDGQTVTLLLQTAFPHYKQHLTLPLSMLSVGEVVPVLLQTSDSIRPWDRSM